MVCLKSEYKEITTVPPSGDLLISCARREQQVKLAGKSYLFNRVLGGGAGWLVFELNALPTAADIRRLVTY